MNKPKSNDLPKSLHTITAIVRVARHQLDAGRASTPAVAIDTAVSILGYRDAIDAHGLVAKALAQLDAAA